MEGSIGEVNWMDGESKEKEPDYLFIGQYTHTPLMSETIGHCQHSLLL